MPKHYRPPGKKKEGNAAKYVTRTQAVKHLQVSLPIFRKLCILKGVFPREPKKKVKGNHQTYYHSKDIAFIHHDPIVEVFRGQRVIDKKVKKALSKKNKDRAESLRRKKPSIDLGRLILQRYPRFVDALGDLDDCLTMVHLFAALPTLQNEKVEVSRIHNCRRLSHEWQAFIARTHKLRKTFISVKGIYYQAEVDGQKITWITPHALQQVMSDDIDYNVMLTFLDFYEALLAFVNFKLYHSIKVTYPPILDPELEALAADLYALSRYVDRRSTSSSLQIDESQLTLGQLQHQLAPSEPGTLMQLIEETDVDDKEDEETKECKSLFKNMKFFLSREVPRESLLFVISAFGGIVSWEGHGAPFDESDQSINYQVVDRPTQGHMFLSREYIQPQWVFDCVNTRLILPTEDYLVGKVPPPHLSPFVNNEEENYTPDYAEKIKQLQAAAKKNVLPVPAIENDDVNDTENAMLEGIASRLEAKEAAEKKKKMLKLERQYHEELKMEVQGVSNASGSGFAEPTSVDIDQGDEVKDTNDMNDDNAKLMMSRRKKGLLEAIEIAQRDKERMGDESDPEFRTGQRVHSAENSRRTGTVMYVGPVEGYSGNWVGVDWDNGDGKHDGSVNGIRYFQSRSERSASFVRPKNLGIGITLLEALFLRYQGVITPEEEDEMFVFSANNRKVSVQLLGKDKLQSKLSHFEELKSASLAYLGVSSVGPPSQISSILPNLKELDLTGNLLSEWKDIAAICQELPRLETLNLSNNILSHDVTCLPLLRNIRVLVLNYTRLKWKQVELLKDLLPSIEELHLMGNEISEITPLSSKFVHGFESLCILNLEENFISDWGKILKLSELTSLEQLHLNKNKLNKLYYPSSDEPFRNLRCLLLGGNSISDLESVDSLNSFPRLKDVRLSENPIGVPRFVLIARLLKVEVLNGSEVSARERKESEIRYVRLVMSKLQDNEDEIKRNHPRFYELKDLHGIQDEKPSIAAIGPQKMSAGLLTVTFKCVGASMGEKPPLTKKLPATTSVGKLKILCESFFKLKSMKLKLFLQEPGSPFPIHLDNEMETLLDVGVGNESTILVDEEC